jgi:NADH-quinone oxidoreductase subunit F
MVKGNAHKREIDMLLDVTKQVEGHTICALGRCGRLADPGPDPHFRHEIEERIDAKPEHAAGSGGIRGPHLAGPGMT